MIALAATLVIMIDTSDCDADIRRLNEALPEYDMICVYPDYAMRPIARPDGLAAEAELSQ